MISCENMKRFSKDIDTILFRNWYLLSSLINEWKDYIHYCDLRSGAENAIPTPFQIWNIELKVQTWALLYLIIHIMSFTWKVCSLQWLFEPLVDKGKFIENIRSFNLRCHTRGLFLIALLHILYRFIDNNTLKKILVYT